jgi:acetoin utilization deacetylase AcuC-like enzyme
MAKYELLPMQLLHEGTATKDDFFEPDIAELSLVLSIHTPEYVKDLMELTLDPRAARKIGFPLSRELVEREFRITQGTIEGALKAFNTHVAFNIAGGTHHAYTHRGEAFCLLNDQAVAAQYLLDHQKAKKILIVDLDVHQGNGTAEIFQNRPEVFTFSMHGKSNYPFKKEQSDLDISLKDGTGDKEYLSILIDTLPTLIEDQEPDFIFYLSGVDILATDKLGKLGCSLEGCKERDRIVFELCKQYHIPVQVSMGGGYSPDIKIIIEAHANTYRVAREVF